MIAQDRSRPGFFDSALQAHRSLSRQGRAHAGEVELDETLEADWSVDAVTARMDIERLLEDLPERQRELIRSVKLEGQSIAEAAKKTGQTELAARVGIHRTLKTLAAKLRGDT